MISFKILFENEARELIDSILCSIPSADAEYLENIVYSLLDTEEEKECALSFSAGCLLIREFYGEYSFVYPIALCEEADIASAVEDIRRYAIHQEIPLVFTDVPSDELGRLLPLFRHANIDAEDKLAECYRVSPLTEAQMVNEIPALDYDGITLSPLTPKDDLLHYALCTDTETNLYWGFDYREDEPNPAKDYFRESLSLEFDRGITVPFAIRLDGEFVGEATLYHFDYIGGCEAAVRILPSRRRLGIAEKALEVLKRYAASLGLLRLCGTVDGENKPSLSLCDKCMSPSPYIEEGKYHYIHDLDNYS